MSQAKVDQYKAEKVNRKKNVKKEKIANRFRVTLVALFCVLCIGYLGFSAYNSISASQEENLDTIEVDITAMDNYLSTIG